MRGNHVITLFLLTCLIFPCFSEEAVAKIFENFRQGLKNHKFSQVYSAVEALKKVKLNKQEKIAFLPDVLKAIEQFPQKSLGEVDSWFALLEEIYPTEPVLHYLWAIESCHWFLSYQNGKAIALVCLGNDQKELSLLSKEFVAQSQSKAFVALAECDLKIKEWRIAKLRLKEALLKDPENKEARKLLAEIPKIIQQGIEKKLEQFRYAIESADFPLGLRAITELEFYPLNDEFKKQHFLLFQQSIEAFANQLNPEELDQWFWNLKRIYPKEPILEFLWVNVHCGYANYAGAKQHMIEGNKWIASSFLPLKEVKQHKSLALTSLAAYNLEQAEWEEANLRILAALKINSENARAYILLGRMSSVHNNWKDVLFYFDKAYNINAKMFYASHYMLYTKALITQKYFEKALKIAQEGVQRFPDFSDLYMRQAELLVALKRRMEGYLSYKMAYLLSNAYSESLQARTKILLNEGKRAKSQPNLPASKFILFFERAVSQLLLDPKESLASIKECETLLGKSDLILNLVRGIALEQDGQIEKAIVLYQELIEKYSHFIPAYLRLFKCFWKQKRYTKMMAPLNQVLKFGHKDNICVVQIYFMSLLDENHYPLKFYKSKERTPLQQEERQAIYVDFDLLLEQLESKQFKVKENALLKLQEFFKKDFGYKSQGASKEMQQAIQSWKKYLNEVRDYLIYSGKHQSFLIYQEAYENKAPVYFWSQLSPDQKKEWKDLKPKEKEFWIRDMRKFLGRSLPFNSKTALPVYLVPNID